MMTPDEEIRLESLFQDAADLIAPERARYLNALRSREPDTARRLERLLASLDRSGDFLAEPVSLESLGHELDGLQGEAGHETFDVSAYEFEGFRVLGQIGSGGSGEVFEAEQLQPCRRVALKVLSEASSRFLDEAQTLARLDHPHIAKVYGAGAAGGSQGTRPWLAMEQVQSARTLIDFAQEEALELRQRVQLFIPVCDAIHHAHRKGVLHRDLKPGNLLVAKGGAGGVKVIDFGLARLLDPVDPASAERTRRGELLGTLHYMSPEQCAGDPALLDVRTDVYALGVVLHELLTGELPYDLKNASLLQVLDSIRHSAVPSPADAHSGIDSDLAAVVLKALEKQPDERYDSASDFAADLRRWLYQEAVLARRVNWVHRTRLFARRRRPLFVGLVAGGILACIAVGTITTLLLLNQKRLDEVARAQVELMEQRVLVMSARDSLAELQAQLDGLQSSVPPLDVAGAFLARAQQERERAVSPEERRAVVEGAVERLRDLASVLGEDADSAASLAKAFVSVGNLHGAEWEARPDDVRNSRQAYEEGVALWRRVVAERPEDGEVRVALLEALIRLADSYRKEVCYQQGREVADEAVALARRGVTKSGTSFEARRQLVDALWARGDLHINLAPYDQGLIDARESLELSQGLLQDEPDMDELKKDLSWSLLRAGLWEARISKDLESAALAHAEASRLREELLLAALSDPQRKREVGPAASSLLYIFAGNELRGWRELGRESVAGERVMELLDAFTRLRGERIQIDALSAMFAQMARQWDRWSSTEQEQARESWLVAYRELSASERTQVREGVAGWARQVEPFGTLGQGLIEGLAEKGVEFEFLADG